MSHFILAVRAFEKEEESDTKDYGEKASTITCSATGKASSSAEHPRSPIVVPIGLLVEITPTIRRTGLQGNTTLATESSMLYTTIPMPWTARKNIIM